ncbi:MAG: bifunctional [glutamate--ammonia ligase]-adenylyl-L-tyrosine phosphorylase/[glutamate--ammonia-ligase] adenylyltransferase [Deltaproteobacteria bacterium]|nr:bifunctional [glutamate--ammonia ligase]-adenylyl-L-tyrosine phosphorylase/[glutamate--ammonia-ligase] adenylyltransferase [Deltaproteobacteria bacterium]
MTDRSGLVAQFRDCLTHGESGESNQRLESLLACRGFTTPARSVANLRFLSAFFAPDLLAEIATEALDTPSPDQALNSLERISGVVDQDDLLFVCGNSLRRSQLLVLCGSSPFLTSIFFRCPTSLHDLFVLGAIDTAKTFHETVALLRSLVADATEYKELFPIFRRFKHAEVLRIAARDLNGLAPLEEVMGELSDLASASLQIAYEACRRLQVRDHGAPLMRTPHGEEEADLVILGMGKLGGRELNFSSDIDLIYFYSSDDGETAGVPLPDGSLKGRISLHAFFAKLAEMISKVVSQVTEDGFVFRVDMGLRPEGKSGDLALSLRSAEIYYESWGQSWERSAMLKAWPVAGSMDLGEEFLRMIEPFVYRKYLDYTLVEDMMSMKKKIDTSLARSGEENIKLGRGGIREIEFFIQALQLVFAGKNAALRQRNSLQALNDLKNAHIISQQDCEALIDAYRFLRIVEHRIQVVNERQTHSLPAGEEEMSLLARRCGYLDEGGLAAFRETLENHRQRVSAIYGDLFLSRDKRREEVDPEISFLFDPNADVDLVKDMLAERGFEEVEPAYQNLLLLRDGPPRSRLAPRNRRLREEIAPYLFLEIIASPDPDMALANLEKFLRAVGSRTSFYSLLAENREIAKLLIPLFGMSEFLSKIFILAPELLDVMVSRSFSVRKDLAESKAELTDLLSQSDDFESSLDILRRYRHEEFLRVGMHDIYGQLDQSEIARQLTFLAEACLAVATEIAVRELGRFGVPTFLDAAGIEREAHFVVVGMGKLGGGELNYHSDLDIIYIYDYQGTTNGERCISNHEYFAKLGQKIISILSIPTREGYAYKIDTRLRPSGNAGPLVTSLESFASYHREEAHVWERQALTKARVVYGEGPLRESIEKVICETVYGSGADEEVRREIHRLRMRMEHELARETFGSYNIKTGRGGMVDVEFIVQYLQLKYGRDCPEIRSVATLDALKALRRASFLSEEDFLTLHDGYTFLRHLENRLRIINDYSMNALGGSKSYLNKLARRLGYEGKLRNPGDALMADYERITEGVRKVYGSILGEGG